MKIKLLFGVLLFLMASSLFAQQSKDKVTAHINAWYEAHPTAYTITAEGKEASATITRHHPKRSNEKNDLIKILYKGMKLELKFNKPFDEITTHKDSLQKYFSYVSIDRIYNDIPTKGWDVYPRTPQSSLGGKGVTFLAGGDLLSLDIDWSIYTVMGYKNSARCNEELSIQDMGVSEACYVAIDKALPLLVSMKAIPLVK